MGIFKSITKKLLPVAGTALGTAIGGATGGNIGGAIGSGIAGGLTESDNRKALQENAAQAREDWKYQFDQNAALQREFAQHGIRWRMEDALAAGVHPVYALGAGGAAAAPQAPMTIGGESPYASMGQDLSRAVAATETADQRALRLASLEHLRAQSSNEWNQSQYWSAQAALLTQRLLGSSAMPSDSGNALLTAQGSEGVTMRWPGDYRSMDEIIRLKPSEVDTHALGNPGVTAGVNPMDQRFAVSGGRHEIVMPSQRLAESWEDMPLIGQIYYGARNLPVLIEMARDRFRERGPTVYGGRAAEWKRRHGVDLDAVWTGSGPAPWMR